MNVITYLDFNFNGGLTELLLLRHEYVITPHIFMWTQSKNTLFGNELPDYSS